jgi:hypothetical protein
LNDSFYFTLRNVEYSLGFSDLAFFKAWKISLPCLNLLASYVGRNSDVFRSEDFFFICNFKELPIIFFSSKLLSEHPPLEMVSARNLLTTEFIFMGSRFTMGIVAGCFFLALSIGWKEWLLGVC